LRGAEAAEASAEDNDFVGSRHIVCTTRMRAGGSSYSMMRASRED
jgi:hypothetical protein